MSEAMIGEIRMFAGNFAPQGWALCEGQILSSAEHSNLFMILGPRYGGDGLNTFALPDLRGRSPIHAGRGPSLDYYQVGDAGGSEENMLSIEQLPSHNHNVSLKAASSNSNTPNPDGAMLAVNRETPAYFEGNTKPVEMNEASIHSDNVGGYQAVNNLSPYLAVSFIIALEGSYPSRS